VVVAHVRTPRGDWVDAGLQALAAGGPDAVRIEALAGRLGVTKGGFYWHFTDRSALLTEMLDAWEQAGADDLIALVDTNPDGPRAQLLQLVDLVRASDGVAVELAVRDWARRDPEVGLRLRRVDERRMDYLRTLFRPLCVDEADVEARSMLLFSLYIGSHFVAAHHGDRTRADVVRLAAERLVADSWTRHAD
jgi:AcrR family transcriptional regulator